MFRNALSCLAGPSCHSIARPSIFNNAVASSAVQIRTFRHSSPALKKRRTIDLDEDPDSSFPSESDSDSLFELTSDHPSALTSKPDRSARRAVYKHAITSIGDLEGKERRMALTALKVGTLRKVVALSDKSEELEELRGVLRRWRVLGERVTEQTATEIVGRPDLAKEFTQNRLQYGLPDVSTHTQQKLKAALATYSPKAASSAASTESISA